VRVRRRPPRAPHASLARKSILIVEDEPLVALQVHMALSTAGASIMSAASVQEAVRLIGYADIAAAIVDVQLGHEDAGRVCDLLARRRIPFVFYTGQAGAPPVLARWPDVQVLKKPALEHEIVSALISVLTP
jgi:CheY-like chemotaxis protein